MTRYWALWALRGLGLAVLSAVAGAACWEFARTRREAGRG